ncbi:hypothetical protein [Turneriella parva]|uniref:FlgD Ig-like domain-containing protein n=1 Tax=Turneriella parva (strain ATCC BAA-1111 / DSM 21527 / NCTC 11395 / H) TaxID=869212 RepID=I4B9B8_TURPD|nr:hypothetical protein [Turneriella parva]AFM13875.1 hypothetical protein Turpa_3236 [Turneriella parva DSM 21527]
MKFLRYAIIAAVTLQAGCSNMPQDDANIIKAYPNPYNPTAGVLTIERTDGSAFAAQNDLIIYDFNLAEVYRANIAPIDTGTNKKLVWGGVDSGGTRVAPGVYYVKVITTSATTVTNADSMFKLIVQ